MTRNLGVDAAVLILRASLGGTLIAHGLRHGRSLTGTAAWFESLGFRAPMLQAKASAVVEVGSGAALVVGAATPLAAAASIGTMVVAAQTVHRPNGFFITDEGYEYVMTIAAASLAAASLGGGRFSIDRAFGLERRLSGTWLAALAGLAGVGGAAAQLKLFWRRPTS